MSLIKSNLVECARKLKVWNEYSFKYITAKLEEYHKRLLKLPSCPPTEDNL